MKCKNIERKVIIIKTKLIVKKKGMYLCIDLNNVLYFENCLRKIIVYFNDKKTQWFYGKFTELLNLLGEETFFVQTHRSFIVNINFISCVYTDNIRFDRCEKKTAPLSKKYFSNLISILTKITDEKIIIS